MAPLMALAASISLATTAITGMRLQATVVVENDGAADVVVTSIEPHALPATAPMALGACISGGRSTVPAGGEQEFYFQLVGLAPVVANPPTVPELVEVSVGATVYANDGSVTEAEPSILTISPEEQVVD